jgi:nucleoside-diphosphate-sugar epimerase
MLFLFFCLGCLIIYGYFLSKNLVTPNPAAQAFAAKPLSDDELAKVTYPTPEDMANEMKAAGPATGKAYIVTGGSGLVGRYIVRTLLGRGETLVRIIDVIPPDVSGDPSAPDHVSRAEFVRADVTDFTSMQDAISRPFGDTGVTAEVVFHTVGVIRHWERLPYLKHLSHGVNIGGTKNVLKASQDLGTVRSFVFTSSVVTVIPPAKHLRFASRNGVVFEDEPVKGVPLSNNHYPASKREADALVRAADGVGGIRTGVLRPGM